MMKYTAPDGYIIESNPLEAIIYVCEANGLNAGFSLETAHANTPIGIQQIQIVRTLDSYGMITITITESNNEELLNYINEVSN